MITRPRGEWSPLRDVARRMGCDWRTLRRYIAGEPFVRMLGGRWYVRDAGFLEWFERQRPTTKAAAER